MKQAKQNKERRLRKIEENKMMNQYFQQCVWRACFIKNIPITTGGDDETGKTK